MKILNLGCGVKTSNAPEITNIDWSIYLQFKTKVFLRPFIPFFIRGERLERFKSLPNNIMVHNLARGIPFESGTVDAVYNSHMLEHLDKEVACRFLLEVKRVLKPGGIHRIVVPDFEKLCSLYLMHVACCGKETEEIINHERYIAQLLEQSVRREGYGTERQKPLHRLIENIVIGDARRRGETHQWMYDRISLGAVLTDCGYTEVFVKDYRSSMIPNWNAYGLDIDHEGNQYKLNSLYIEAVK